MHRLHLEETPPKTGSEAQLTTDNVPVDEVTHSDDNQISAQPQVHTINLETPSDMKQTQLKSFLVLAVVAILAGVGTGFGSYKLSASQSPSTAETTSVQPEASSVKKGDIFGHADVNEFKDSALGYLEVGGLEGEGSHRLLRPGGISQTVYLTSSVTDLNELAGMDVKIWGETYKGQKAGWLMDVGRIEVLDPKGHTPTEE
jgi:hypothetical protein